MVPDSLLRAVSAPAPAAATFPVRPLFIGLAVAIVAAYAPGLRGPLVFDDVAAVTQNPSLHSVLTSVQPPPGLSTTGRPLANLSLALNYALGGEATWGYHLGNLALHVGNALLVFALLRRTVRHLVRAAAADLGDAVAFAAALVWALHPLHTGAVTYVMQRTELLAAAGLLGALYAFVRAAETTRHRRAWTIASVLATFAGMASKETAAVAPLLIWTYDRALLAGSWRGALRARSGYYAALAFTWLLPALLVLGTDNRGASAGLAADFTWGEHACTQLWALGHYFRLFLWPHPLVFDYGALHMPADARLVFPLGLLLACGAAAVRFTVARLVLLAASLLLAPSTLVPIATQTVAEHRVYLVSVLPCGLLMLGLARAFPQRLALLAITTALAMGVTTFARNDDYTSAVRLWTDTAAKVPDNARAHYNLAVHLLAADADHNALRAVAALEETLRRDPAHAAAAAKLGATLLRLERPADAVAPLQTAARLIPADAAVHYQLAAALIGAGRSGEALPALATAVRLNPSHAAARANYGRALTAAGRYAEALAEFTEAARLDPTDTSAQANAARLRAYLQEPPR